MTLDLIVLLRYPHNDGGEVAWVAYDLDRDIEHLFVQEAIPLEWCRGRVLLTATNPRMTTSLKHYVLSQVVDHDEPYLWVFCLNRLFALHVNRLARKRWQVRWKVFDGKRWLNDDTFWSSEAFYLSAREKHDAIVQSILALRRDVVAERSGIPSQATVAQVVEQALSSSCRAGSSNLPRGHQDS